VYIAANSKNYTSAEKLRLIAADYFFYDRRRATVFEMFGKGRLSLEEIDAYFESRNISAGQNEIERAVEFVFREPYSPGRFNDNQMPTLYTAKDEMTCREEKRFYLAAAGVKQLEYVIFSVLFTGNLIDLRRSIDLRTWTMPIDHGPCQLIGVQIAKEGYDGIVAPSARNAGGSCCAIFVRTTVVRGSVKETGCLTV